MVANKVYRVEVAAKLIDCEKTLLDMRSSVVFEREDRTELDHAVELLGKIFNRVIK